MLANVNTPQSGQWSNTWDALLADQLNAEISVIAYQGQGYCVPGAGGVPDFIHSYALIRKGERRVFSKPDYVFVLHGQNGHDPASKQKWQTTTADQVVKMMKNIRSAYPEAKMLFFGTPFSDAGEDPIQQAFDSHWNEDLDLHSFNLGQLGQRLTKQNSFDGVHPNSLGHQKLEEWIWKQISVFFR